MYTLESKIKEVLNHPQGRELLFAHGYSIGEGYIDILSQYQSVQDAIREGRLRDHDKLIKTLNNS